MTLRKKVEADEDLPNIVVPFAIDLDLVLSAKVSDVALMEQVLALAVKDVRKRFAKDGFQVFVREGFIRPITREELVALMPRKIHLSDGKGRWKCSTTHVSAKNVTNVQSDVTCKLCLRFVDQP